MTNDVEQIEPDGADESWERVTSDPDVHGVFADRIDFERGWNVSVAAMEFVRREPLVGELRRRIGAALQSVDGVEAVNQMDTEIWFVTGTPSGPPLVRAVAGVLDDLAEQIREFLAP